MEAVPRMPMLSFDLKTSPKSTDFSPILKKYITQKYHEDPANYSKECADFDQLRASACKVSTDFIGCSLLKKYYSQLCFLQNRFPLTDSDELTISFTWEDAHTGVAYTQKDVGFEQACILYNIGALHSVLGASDTRQSAEGMKISCTHFQCAAWALQHLHDSFPPSWSQDMDHELLTFQVNLMLAQAQECILEKSMTDNRKSTITAKVAAQIVEYYRQALKNIEPFLGAIKKAKDWKKRMELKSKYYECVTCLYMGNQAEEQQKWGERLAFYQASLSKLDECSKLAKKDQADILEALRFTMDVVGGKHNAAKKDNDFVYHEKVPEISSLPEVKGASLVKGIAFDIKDPEIAGQDIFSRLVPMEAHEASSMYSEEKAQLLRAVGNEIDDKNEELVQFLASLQLDQSKLSPEPDRLPQILLEKCAAISVQPNAVKDLVDAMQHLSSISLDVNTTLEDIEAMLEDDDHKENEYQQITGKWVGNIIISEISKEGSKYKEGHTKASQSNTDLHKAMNEHISRLKLLAGPLEELQAKIPSLEAIRNSEDGVIIEKLMMLLGKIDEMKNQRLMLNEQLRKAIQDDDITKILVTRGDTNQEEFFKEQIQKHDQTVTYIHQNLAAQDNILRALTETNADYANIRRATVDITQRREEMIQSLIQSYDVYEDLLAKSKKGIEFYDKLESNVTKLYQRLKGVCKVRDEERDQVMERLRPKGPPPARPSAPKPNLNMPSPAVAQGEPDHDPDDYQGPTLKDFLPFMKPQTFGNLKNVPAAFPQEGGALPVVTGNVAPSPGVTQPASAGLPPVQMSQNGLYPTSQMPQGMPRDSSPQPMPQRMSRNDSNPVPQNFPGAVPPGQALPPQDAPAEGLQARPGQTQAVPGYGNMVSQQAPMSQPSAGYHPRAARPESAHTVDTVHAPLMTPGQAPSAQPQMMPPSSQSYYPTSQAPPPSQVNVNQTMLPQESHPSMMRNAPPPQINQAPTGGPYQQPPIQYVNNQVPSGGQYPNSSQQYSSQPAPSSGYNVNQGPPVSAPTQPTPNTRPSYPPQGVVLPNQPPLAQYPQPPVSSQFSGGNRLEQPQGVQSYGQQVSHNQRFVPPTASIPPEQVKQVTPPNQYQQVQPQPGYQAQHTGYGSQGQPVQNQQVPVPPQAQGHVGQQQNYMGQGQMPSTSLGQIPQQPYQVQGQVPGNQGQQQFGGQQGQITARSQGQVPQQPYQSQGHMAGTQGQISTNQNQISAGFQSRTNMTQPQATGGQVPFCQGPMSVGNQPQMPGQSHQMGQNQPQGQGWTGQQPMQQGQTQQPAVPQGNNQPIQAPYISSQGQISQGQPMGPGRPAVGSVAPQQNVGQQNMQYRPQQPPGQLPNISGGYPGSQQPSRQQVPNQNLVPKPPVQGQSQIPPGQGQGQIPPVRGQGQIPPVQVQGQIPPGQVQGQMPGYQQTGQGQYPPMNRPSQTMTPPTQQGYPQGQVPQNQGQQVPQGHFQGQTQQPQGHGSPHHQASQYQQPTSFQSRNMSPQLSARPNQGYPPKVTPLQIKPGQQQPKQLPSPLPNNLQQPLMPTASVPQQIQYPQQNTPPVVQHSGGPPLPPVGTTLPPGGPVLPPAGLPVQQNMQPQPQFPLLRQNSSSSTDDLLSSSPSHPAPSTSLVLTPKVLTAEDIQQQKEEELRNTIRQKHNDPYADRAVLESLIREVDKLERKLENLTRREDDGGLAILDKEWKVLAEDQERESKKQSMAIAKCYPMKNRFQDILPYDNSRVALTMQKDDYINASHIDSLAASCPKFIATQAPLPMTYADFWLMVYEQGSEVVVLLVRDEETNKQKPHVYWPTEKGQRISHGPIELTLQSLKERDYWQERLITLSHRETRNSRTLIHLQFTAWPLSGIPEKAEPLLQFISECHSFYKQQRNLMKPVVVHCGSGVCRTGIFCVVYTAVQEMNMGNGIISVVDTIRRLRQKRKYMVEEKDHLKFCYEAVLQYAMDLFATRGIPNKRTTNVAKKSSDTKTVYHANEGILGDLSSFRDIQSSVEKFHIRDVKPDDLGTEGQGHLVPLDATDITAMASSMTSSHSSAHNGVNSFDDLFDIPDEPSVGSGDGGAPVPGAETTSLKPAERSRSNSNSSAQSLGSLANSPAKSVQSMPPSLADLQNPNTFTLDTSTPPNKKKITKASFFNPSSGLQDSMSSDSGDPFSSLDPLWTITNTKEQSDSS
ncbi:tyrosine-protein phosphatase non-receptor type 23-like [Lineus longissimus]|uniref:tyrosine-protein phosphatase non-receptor type 23-like n=1 Tax=Lineus longissimus TaxID=88925 RepID=UPI002B4DFDD9